MSEQLGKTKDLKPKLGLTSLALATMLTFNPAFTQQAHGQTSENQEKQVQKITQVSKDSNISKEYLIEPPFVTDPSGNKIQFVEFGNDIFADEQLDFRALTLGGAKIRILYKFKSKEIVIEVRPKKGASKIEVRIHPEKPQRLEKNIYNPDGSILLKLNLPSTPPPAKGNVSNNPWYPDLILRK